METIVGLKELREHMETYVRQLHKGKSLVVVRKSKPLFRMVPLDEDDSSLWETVIDFTKIKKGGVPITEVIAALRHEQAPKGTK